MMRGISHGHEHGHRPQPPRAIGIALQLSLGLSEDGNTINNEYVRMDENGDIMRVTHAVYERIR